MFTLAEDVSAGFAVPMLGCWFPASALGPAANPDQAGYLDPTPTLHTNTQPGRLNMVRITPLSPEHDPPLKRQKTKPKPKPSPSSSATSTSTAVPRPSPQTAADYYVRDIPGLSPPSKLSIYAGHIQSTLQSHPPQAFDSDASLYFLLAKNRHIPKRERLLIW